MALTEESARLRLAALKRLYLATREKWNPEQASIYVENTAGFSTAVVTSACRRLEGSAEWFPKASELVEECRLVAKRLEVEAEDKRRKRLPPAELTPEQKSDILAKFRKVLEKKTF